MNLAYVDLVVVVPIAAVVLLLAARRIEVVRGVRNFAWCALFLAPLGYYATFVERFHLVEERATIPISPLRDGRETLRIAVLADIQGCDVEPQMREAVAAAMAFEPHLILLPGDLIQCPPGEYERAVPKFRELLAPLDAPLGVYFVVGNTDDPTRVGEALEGTRVRMLVNETVELQLGDRRITLGGAGMSWVSKRDVQFVHDLEQRPGDGDVRILVSHFPDIVENLSASSRVDLLVAGHTHGGQVQLPFIGPPITLSRVPRSVGAGGYHVLDGHALYVSRGVGCERGLAPRLRFLCPPEVSLLTLETH
jgi:predicted MPP superfamily phosphohydrolase